MINSNPLPASPLSGGGVNAKTIYVPYKKELVNRAREFRNNPTASERKIWEEILKDKNLTGYKFTRQKPLGNFIVDFYCAKLMLAIEIDGEIHMGNNRRDNDRTYILENKFGAMILRYKNEEVLNKIDSILENLKQKIKSREKFLNLNT